MLRWFESTFSHHQKRNIIRCSFFDYASQNGRRRIRRRAKRRQSCGLFPARAQMNLWLCTHPHQAGQGVTESVTQPLTPKKTLSMKSAGFLCYSFFIIHSVVRSRPDPTVQHKIIKGLAQILVMSFEPAPFGGDKVCLLF